MSYLKLCQLLNQSDITIHYLEDCMGNVIVNEPNFPLNLECEVINWVSEEDFLKRGNIESFNTENITVLDNSIPIRQYVLNQLIGKYPGLVI